MNSQKITLYPHPTSLNHGCEAIAVSTARIFKKTIPSCDLTLLTKYTSGHLGDMSILESDYQITYAPMPQLRRYSKEWFKYQIFKYIFHKDKVIDSLAKQYIREQKSILDENDVFVSIGGDNYCYGRPGGFYGINKAVNMVGKKSILWGCSIEPSAIDGEMAEDLKRYSAIFARESLTYNALKEKGLTNIFLSPDPAFVLELKEDKNLFIPENTVGINISPMILEYAKNGSVVYDAYLELIKFILFETNMNIALIPHVTIHCTDDRTILRKLKQEFDSDRIIMFDDMDCQRLKYIISKCRFFVGARTHSTIAAYSTNVPTLVCGYSVKSKGIATDLFGTYENYVVPVQNMTDKEQLLKSFKWIYENERTIRTRLTELMPSYKEKVWKAGEILKNVIE